MARLTRCIQCPRCGSASFRKVRADAVVSLVKVRECRKCSQQYRAPMHRLLAALIILVGLGMTAWLAVRALEVRFDRYKLLEPIAPVILAAVGVFVVLYGLFKLLFQRGVKPPERHSWRERREPLPPAAPMNQSIVGITHSKSALPEPVSKPSNHVGAVPVVSTATSVVAAAPSARPSPAAVAVTIAPLPQAAAAAPAGQIPRPVLHVHNLPMPSGPVLAVLRRGTVIPAHALALNARREFNERRMRALTRYYLAAGAQGVAVGVHTTQFAIRKPKHNLLRPVLEIASQELRQHESVTGRPIVKIAGICGQTRQAVAEAELAAQLGYDIGLLNISAMPADASEFDLVDHCKRVGRAIPLMGFYLQPAVGGRDLPFSFWRALAEVPNVVAIKIAAFNRYKTLEIMRAIAESGRAMKPGWTRSAGDGDEHPIAVYTGNDDHIIEDLLGEFTFDVNGAQVSQRIVGGLLGHWACWTKAAVDTFESIRRNNESGTVPAETAILARQITDMNGALFDARNNFKGCIAGVQEVLFRQHLLDGNECLEPSDMLSPGQADEITRVSKAYPHLTDDEFVREHLDKWMR